MSSYTPESPLFTGGYGRREWLDYSKIIVPLERDLKNRIAAENPTANPSKMVRHHMAQKLISKLRKKAGWLFRQNRACCQCGVQMQLDGVFDHRPYIGDMNAESLTCYGCANN